MKKIIIILSIVAVLTLSGCADQVPATYCIKEVGFWYGVWHGMIAPFAFIVSLFNDDIAIYAVYNNGGWYNFGFLLGIGSWRSVIINRN